MLFEYILLKKDRWIWVKNELLLLYCFCRIWLWGETADWNVFTEYGMTRLKKTQAGNQYIYVPEFKVDVYPNDTWKRWMVKLFDEMDSGRFRQQYVLPQLRDFLERMKAGEDWVLNLLEYIGLQVEIDERNEISGGQMYMPEDIELMEIMEIAELFCMLGESMSTKEITALKNRKAICQKEKKKIVVDLRKEKDIAFLKKCGVYTILEEFLNRAEAYLSLH